MTRNNTYEAKGNIINKWRLMLIIMLAGICWSCSERKQQADATFQVLDSKRTGLEFSNDLKYDQRFNLFKYIYFYNGSGVGAGDFNNDGLVDLFFGSNQGNNRLYLNTGNLRFKDITTPAQVPEDGGWTTGVSVVDINNDGLLDIYVCRVGQYEILKGKNQLLINQGVDKQGNPRFVDEAKAYGLDFSGFSGSEPSAMAAGWPTRKVTRSNGMPPMKLVEVVW